MIEKATMGKIVDEQDYDLLSYEIKKVKTLIDDCRARQYPGIDFSAASIEQVSEITGRCFNLG